MKKIDISQLIKFEDKILTHFSGPRSGPINGISDPEHIRPQSAVFISKADQIPLCSEKGAQVVIALQTLKPEFEIRGTPYKYTVFFTKNLKVAMSATLPLFDDKLDRFNFQIHPTALVSSSAKIGENSKIGPYTVIGDHVVIGSNSIIGTHCNLENNSKIGSHSLLHGFVHLGAYCEIGDSCEIHPQTCIGSDGFGYLSDENYNHHKIPQLGKVVIEDRVEIGSSCCIDRATLSETRIKKGTKIDNLCHIAHNCSLGENSLIAAGFFVAGSSSLGNHFTSGGNSVVSTHIKICDGVTLGGRSTVTKNITEPGQYAGYPLQQLKEALKTISSLTHLVEMRKKITKICQILKIEDE